MKIVRYFTTISIFCLFMIGFSVQSVRAIEFDTGLQFRTGFPQGEFSRHVKNTGFGLGGYFGLIIPESPIMIGADAGFMVYGLDNRKEPFSPSIPDVTVDVETSNNIVTSHLFLRLQPDQMRIRPYFEGLFGFSYFFTETSIRDEDNVGEDIASTTNLDDFVLSYGVGGGLQIRVYDDPFKENKLSSVYVDLGIRYLAGGEAEYLKKGSIEVVNQNVRMDVINSRTDLLFFQIGANLAF